MILQSKSIDVAQNNDGTCYQIESFLPNFPSIIPMSRHISYRVGDTSILLQKFGAIFQECCHCRRFLDAQCKQNM